MREKVSLTLVRPRRPRARRRARGSSRAAGFPDGASKRASVGSSSRLADADGLSRWYAEHLGVGAPPAAYDGRVWTPEPRPTVFAPFGAEHWDSPYLGPTGWGINFRVNDLDAMVEQLRGAGIDVEIDTEVYPNGRFAQLDRPRREHGAALGAGVTRRSSGAMEIDGRRYAWRSLGAGPPLVLLNGYSASAQDWDPTLLAGSPRVQVDLPDHRGIGESELGDPGAVTIERWPLTFERLLDELGIDRAASPDGRWAASSRSASPSVLRDGSSHWC